MYSKIIEIAIKLPIILNKNIFINNNNLMFWSYLLGEYDKNSIYLTNRLFKSLTKDLSKFKMAVDYI